jgi:hypothetical protein
MRSMQSNPTIQNLNGKHFFPGHLVNKNILSLNWKKKETYFGQRKDSNSRSGSKT